MDLELNNDHKELGIFPQQPICWNQTCSNDDSVNHTDDPENKTPSPQDNEVNPFYFYELETLTFLSVLLLFIVIGNSAVLLALLLGKNQRKSRMNFFIMHLALADLAVGLINVVTDIAWKVTVSWYAGNVACKIVKYFQTVVIYASNYVLVALSIDRYDAITHPLNFTSSWRRAKWLIASAWFLSFLFAIPAALLFHEADIGQLHPVRQCWIDMKEVEWKIYITVITTAVFMIPAFIIAVCYILIVHTIWTKSRILTPTLSRHNRGQSGGQGMVQKFVTWRRGQGDQNEEILFSDDTSKRASSRGLIPRAKIKSVKMTFTIVSVFILCSSPYYVFSLLQVFKFIPHSQAMVALSTFFTSLSPLNSAANPIIYCLFSTHIFRDLRKLKTADWLILKFCPSLARRNLRTNQSTTRSTDVYTQNRLTSHRNISLTIEPNHMKGLTKPVRYPTSAASSSELRSLKKTASKPTELKNEPDRV